MSIGDRMNDFKPKVRAHISVPDIGWPPKETPRAAPPEPTEVAAPSWPDMATLVARTAETPIASTVHEPFGSPTGPGLFHVKGLQLPAYVQHVAHHLVAQGHTESQAIRIAIGVIKNWAAGHDGHGNAVHPDVQAAAAKAVAEWEAAKAAAHAGNSKGRAAARTAEYRVGPKGYIHGWIFVGAPGVGAKVFHPHHGHGTVSAASGGHATVKFHSGAEHSFEVRPGKGPAKLQPRPAPGSSEVADAHKTALQRLSEIPGLLGVHGQLISPSDRRLAAVIGDIQDELSAGPGSADWGYIRGKMAALEAAEQDAVKRGEQGSHTARALAAKLGDLRRALDALARSQHSGKLTGRPGPQ